MTFPADPAFAPAPAPVRGIRVVKAVLLTVLVVLAGSWLLSLTAVLMRSRADQARKADAIVVLGAAQYAGRPSPVLRARIDHGITLWQRGIAPRLLFTGGTGTGDTTSEAAVARRYAMRHGVPAAAILVEDRGRTTSESMEGVATILREHGLARVVLVSDPFHMLRLDILARRYGVVAYTSPTRTSPISANREESWSYVLSESIKVPAALLQAELARRAQ